MFFKKIIWMKLALIGMFIFSLYCIRDNPFDPKSNNYISGTQPQVKFIQRNLKEFKFDTISIQILCIDVPAGATQSGIKKLTLSWSGDTSFQESAEAITNDTFTIKKVLPTGVYMIEAVGIDYDNRESEIDTMTLMVLLYCLDVSFLTPNLFH